MNKNQVIVSKKIRTEELTLLPRRQKDGQQDYKKVFLITDYKEMQSKTRVKYDLSENGIYQIH